MKARKTMNRLLGMILMLVLMISLLPLASLAADPPKAAITVSGGEENSTVTAYQLIEVTFDTVTNSPQEPMYKWQSSVADWVANQAGGAYIGQDGEVTDAFLNLQGGPLAAFYDAAAAAIRKGTITPPASDPQMVSSLGKATIPNRNMGGYLVLVENGMEIYRPSSAKLVPVWNLRNSQWVVKDCPVELKHSTPGITKKIAEGDDLLDVSHASVGDTVTYDLVVDIPQYPANALAKSFAVGDSLPQGLKLDYDSIRVFGIKDSDPIPDLTAANSEQNYYEKTSNNQAENFLLTFDYDKISTFQKLRITYTAQLQDDAVPGSAYENTAFLKYSNNPYEPEQEKIKEDSATVYTFGISLTKADEQTEAGLAGAKFSVSARENNENPLKFILISEGKYRHALPGEGNSVTELVTGENGTLEITGLKPGTWYLTETAAPAGYVKLSTPITAVLADADRNGKLETDSQETTNTLSVYDVTVTNRKGFSLPQTGGIGTILFSAGGVVLAGLGTAMIVLFLQKKRRI